MTSGELQTVTNLEQVYTSSAGCNSKALDDIGYTGFATLARTPLTSQ